MNAFFDALIWYEKAYFIVGLLGTVFFLLQSVFTFFDLGETFDIDSDFDGEVDSDLSFLGISMPLHLFSIRGIIGFILVFGWSGFGFSKGGSKPLTAFLLALLFGFIMMLIISLIYYGMEKLTSDGTINKNDAVGRTGTVYLRIPKEKSGMGKVSLVTNGSLKEYDAKTEFDTIPYGENVKVVNVIDHVLMVEKISGEEE